MRTHHIPPALAILAAAGICMGVAGGGCGGQRTANSEADAATPGPAAPRRDAVTLGTDSRLIGRLEQPAIVRATVYEANGDRGKEADVEIVPGTWLVPERVFTPPEQAGGRE